MNAQQQAISRKDRFMIDPAGALWSLAIPVMGGMSIHMIYNITDMLFIGRVSPDALAAVAFNMPLFFFVMGLTQGIGSGLTAVIARFIGAGDKSGADNTALHGVVIGLILSVFLGGAAILWGNIILSAIGTPAALFDLAWSYLHVISLGLPFIILSGTFRSILAGEGDTKMPMLVGATGTVLNIILDPLFIFVLDLGLRGAAIATVISQLLVLAVMLYIILVKKRSFITFRRSDFQLSKPILRDVFAIGIP
ncbi:MAG: MATE family efflux transporter, partial [Candidatus Neomarinimicrobiota bacterium]